MSEHKCGKCIPCARARLDVHELRGLALGLTRLAEMPVTEEEVREAPAEDTQRTAQAALAGAITLAAVVHGRDYAVALLLANANRLTGDFSDERLAGVDAIMHELLASAEPPPPAVEVLHVAVPANDNAEVPS